VHDDRSLAEKEFRPFPKEKFHSFVCVGGQLVIGVALKRRLAVRDAPEAAVGDEVVRQTGTDLTRSRDVDAEGGGFAAVLVCSGRTRRGATVDVVATSYSDHSTFADHGQRPARHHCKNHSNRPYFRTGEHFHCTDLQPCIHNSSVNASVAYSAEERFVHSHSECGAACCVVFAAYRKTTQRKARIRCERTLSVITHYSCSVGREWRVVNTAREHGCRFSTPVSHRFTLSVNMSRLNGPCSRRP